MVDYKVTGNRIKNYRQASMMTQEKLTELVGITVVYLSKTEDGHVRPSIDLLDAICEALHCDLGNTFQSLSPSSVNYQNEKVLDLFNACSSSIAYCTKPARAAVGTMT